MKRSKRLLSIALSLALAVGMIPMFGVTASAAEMCTVTFHNNGHGTLKVESIQIEKGKSLQGSGTLQYRETLMGKADGLQHAGWGKTPSAIAGGDEEFNMNSTVEGDMDLYAIWSPYIDHVALSLPESSKPVAGAPIPAEPKVDLVYPVNTNPSKTYYEIYYSDADWIKGTVWLDEDGKKVTSGTFKNNEKYTLRVNVFSYVTYTEGALPFTVDTNLNTVMTNAALDGRQADEIKGDTDSNVILYFNFEIGTAPTKYKVDIGAGEPDKGHAEPGETVTITAIEDGYEHGYYYKFDHWEVMKGGVTLKDPGSRTTTFVMPANDVEINAVFKAVPNQIMKDITVKLDKPVTGAKPASTVWCAGANFQSLTWYRWVSMERGIMDWEKMPSTASFQEGKKYMAEIMLVPQAGQEFAPESELTLTFNGSPSNENIAERSSFNLIIRKEFTATSPSANPFVDVTESDYFYEPVLWAVKKNITKGTDDTHFSPDATCTRAQVVTFLWRAAGSPAPSSTSNPFTDVSPSDYYYNAVLWAVGKGITNGLDATTFGSDRGCTRGQVVTFLHRYENTPAPSSYSNPFTDVINGEYYYNAVLWAVGKGITNGLDATTFGPNQTCTRGQIVTFLYRDMK